MPATTTRPHNRGSNFTKAEHLQRHEESRRGTEEFFARDAVLGGTLLRVGPEYWRWRDGAAEPRVTELTLGEWGFALRSDRGGDLVEVRRSVFALVPPLRWVVEGWRAGLLRAGSGPATAEGPREAARGAATVAWPGEAPSPHASAWLDRDDPAPAAILVPLAEWNLRVGTGPAAAAWDSQHDADILGRAHALGWRPPVGYVSPAGWAAPCPGSASERALAVGVARLEAALEARLGPDGHAVVRGGEPARAGSGLAPATALRVVGVPAAEVDAVKTEADGLARRILGTRAAMCIVAVCPRDA